MPVSETTTMMSGNFMVPDILVVQGDCKWFEV